MKKILKKLSMFTLSAIMVAGTTINVAAFSEKLYSYSGWCGTTGIQTQGSFYNDDGVFFLDNNIESFKDGATGLKMEALKHGTNGYEVVDTATRNSTGNSTVWMYGDPGEYKVKFIAIGIKNCKVYFNGNVHDDL